ncbi:MAG: hypothetical protein ABJB33_10615 [Gemmatimonadota bacterium]
MAFPPKKDHRIPLAQAVAMTKAHRANTAKGDPNAGMWPRDVFETLLAQPGAAGIRIYHGRGTDGAKHMVMVAVDATGDDMTSATIMEQEFPCPPLCPVNSPLAS